MKLVIFAGGSGTRLWPVSRRRTPKQAQPFIDNQTLLQKTYRRLRRGWPAKDIWLSTSAEQYRLLRRQLPQLPRRNVILEPARRETAAAIGLAATILEHHHPKTIMATVWSDAYIKEPEKYIAALKAASRVVNAHPGQTAMIGLKPRFADTGLGYIKMKGPNSAARRRGYYLVDRFIEKPNQPTANRFVTAWQYLWNPGMFVFRTDAMLEKFHRWLPTMARSLRKIKAALGQAKASRVLGQEFPAMKKISIDYAIMEKDTNMFVLPADFTWSDIGTWSAVYNMLAEHPTANVLRGRHVTHDSQGNLIYSYTGKLIATAGVHNMIIIETSDAILVCPRHRTQDVKYLVAALEAQGLKGYT